MLVTEVSEQEEKTLGLTGNKKKMELGRAAGLGYGRGTDEIVQI